MLSRVFKMNDGTLLKFALIGSLIGILIILIVGEMAEISDSNIREISKKNLDEMVKVKGHVNSLKETTELYILNIKDNTGYIDVVAFKKEGDEFKVKEGDRVEVEGVVSEYKDSIQISADLIKLI